MPKQHQKAPSPKPFKPKAPPPNPHGVRARLLVRALGFQGAMGLRVLSCSVFSVFFGLGDGLSVSPFFFFFGGGRGEGLRVWGFGDSGKT